MFVVIFLTAQKYFPTPETDLTNISQKYDSYHILKITATRFLHR